MMPSKAEQIKVALDELIKDGNDILEKFNKDNYNIWYSKAIPVVRQLINDRFEEFQEYFKLKEKPDKHYNRYSELEYTIQDFLNDIVPKWATMGSSGEHFDTHLVFKQKFQNQLGIVKGARERLKSILTNIEGLLQADLFDNELDEANHLLDNNFIRAAGAVAGVVLEGHLKTQCKNHGILITKKHPGINDLNEKLYKDGIYDLSQKRQIEWCADIRNKCDHKKETEPTKEEVLELIEKVDKIIKTF